MSTLLEQTLSTASHVDSNRIVWNQSDSELAGFDTASIFDQVEKIRSSGFTIKIIRDNLTPSISANVNADSDFLDAPHFFASSLLSQTNALVSHHRGIYNLRSLQVLLEAESNLQSLEVKALIFIKDLKEELNRYISADDEMGALNVIFDRFDNELLDGHASLIKKVLVLLDIEVFTPKILVGILSVTKPWKTELIPSRESFVEKIRQHFLSVMSLDRTSRLLTGLV